MNQGMVVVQVYLNINMRNYKFIYHFVFIFCQQFLTVGSFYILSLLHRLMNHHRTISFIEQMHTQLKQYQLEKLQRQERLSLQVQPTEKQKLAKQALIKIQQTQNNKYNTQERDLIGAWTNLKTLPNILKETPKDHIKTPSEIEIIKRNSLKSTRGLLFLSDHQNNNIIPHLKCLLEKLNSPVKKKQVQNGRKQKLMHSRDGYRSKPKIGQRHGVKTREEGRRQWIRDDGKNKDDFRNFQEIKPHQQRETLRTKQNNRISSSRDQKIPSLKENRACYSKEDRIYKYFYHQNPQTDSKQNLEVAHNFINTNSHYEKIKRKHPSAYNIDVAHDKQILNQLLKGTLKEQSNYHSLKPSSARSKAQKFTLTNLLS